MIIFELVNINSLAVNRIFGDIFRMYKKAYRNVISRIYGIYKGVQNNVN